MRSHGAPGALLPRARFRFPRTGPRQRGRPPWRAVYRSAQQKLGAWLGGDLTSGRRRSSCRTPDLKVYVSAAARAWVLDTCTVFPNDVPIVAVRVRVWRQPENWFHCGSYAHAHLTDPWHRCRKFSRTEKSGVGVSGRPTDPQVAPRSVRHKAAVLVRLASNNDRD